MRKSLPFNPAILLVLVLFTHDSLSQEYTRWGLPEGAKARLGKGNIGFGRAVAYSPDGTQLAVASGIGIWLYDARTGNEISLIEGSGGGYGVQSVTFSPDGNTLASAEAEGTVVLWDSATGQPKKTFYNNTSGPLVAISPDGTILVTGGLHEPQTAKITDRDDDYYTAGQGTIQLWEVATGQRIETFQTQEGVSNVAFSPDGNILAVAGDRRVLLWDVTTGQRIKGFQGHRGWVGSVAFSPDGTTLASGGHDGRVLLWEVATGQRLNVFESHELVSTVEFSPDGATLASAGENSTVLLWDVATGQHQKTLEGHSGWITSVAFSPDGSTLASAGRDDGTVVLWEVTTGQRENTIQGHYGEYFRFMSFSPDAKTLACSFLWQDSSVYLLDVGTGQRMALEHRGSVRSVVFSPDGTTLATSSGGSGVVQFWDVATGKLEKTFGSGWVLAFSPDGNTLATWGSGSLSGEGWLLDVATGERIKTFQGGPAKSTYSVDISPDGTILAVGGSDNPGVDGTVHLLDVGTGQTIRTLEGHTAGVHTVAFLSDGNTLASIALNNRVAMWDVATGERKPINTTGDMRGGYATGFSPDGSIIGTGDRWGGVNIWAAATGEIIHRFPGHPVFFFRVWSVAFSPDGTTLATNSSDGTILLWDVSPYITPTVVEFSSTSPVQTALESNYPNPFNASTQIPYRLTGSGPVRLVIYNVLGQPVRTLVDEVQSAGFHQASWDGKDDLGLDVTSGVYLLRIHAGEQRLVQKITLLR